MSAHTEYAWKWTSTSGHVSYSTTRFTTREEAQQHFDAQTPGFTLVRREVTEWEEA